MSQEAATSADPPPDAGGSRQFEPDDAALFPAAGVLRQARRIADLSQRQLAACAGVPHSVVGRIEAGRVQPRVDLYARLLIAADVLLVPLDSDGHELRPIWDGAMRDAAGRHFPAHLDVQRVGGVYGGVWWYQGWDFARYPIPLVTFDRLRSIRDLKRVRNNLHPCHMDAREEMAREHPGIRSRRAVDPLGDWF